MTGNGLDKTGQEIALTRLELEKEVIECLEEATASIRSFWNGFEEFGQKSGNELDPTDFDTMILLESSFGSGVSLMNKT